MFHSKNKYHSKILCKVIEQCAWWTQRYRPSPFPANTVTPYFPMMTHSEESGDCCCPTINWPQQFSPLSVISYIHMPG